MTVPEREELEKSSGLERESWLLLALVCKMMGWPAAGIK